jgi:hypothetical protein
MAVGLPIPGEDLGAHFLAVARLFVESPVTVVIQPKQLPSIVPIVSPPVPLPQPVSVSPSASLPAFWQQHHELHSFLLISSDTFTVSTVKCPSFSIASVGAKDFVSGIYSLKVHAINRYDGKIKQWVSVVDFPLDAQSVDFLNSKQVRYFRLS